MLLSSAFLAEWGENETRASIFFSPSLVHWADAVPPKSEALPALPVFVEGGEKRLYRLPPGQDHGIVRLTKKPRQEKLVEPQTAFFTLGPLTTIVLLCWSLPIWCRLTLVCPAEAIRRLAA